MATQPKRDPERTDLTAAVLVWVWDQVLVDQAAALDAHGPRAERAVAAAKSELLRLGLIDELGIPTKEGRHMLGLI